MIFLLVLSEKLYIVVKTFEMTQFHPTTMDTDLSFHQFRDVQAKRFWIDSLKNFWACEQRPSLFLYCLKKVIR